MGLVPTFSGWQLSNDWCLGYAGEIPPVTTARKMSEIDADSGGGNDEIVRERKGPLVLRA